MNKITLKNWFQKITLNVSLTISADDRVMRFIIFKSNSAIE